MTCDSPLYKTLAPMTSPGHNSTGRPGRRPDCSVGLSRSFRSSQSATVRSCSRPWMTIGCGSRPSTPLAYVERLEQQMAAGVFPWIVRLGGPLRWAARGSGGRYLQLPRRLDGRRPAGGRQHRLFWRGSPLLLVTSASVLWSVVPRRTNLCRSYEAKHCTMGRRGCFCPDPCLVRVFGHAEGNAIWFQMGLPGRRLGWS